MAAEKKQARALENLRVVLVATRNPLNIGAVARAMSNFGAARLRVVNPYESAWREAKSAVGAAELLAGAEEFASVPEAVADCTLVVGTTAVGHREIRQSLRNLPDASPLILRRLAKVPVAVLFGSEKWGLSNESLSYCHWLLHIPTRSQHRSMNLGQAVAVCLYELARQRSKRVTSVISAEGKRPEPRGPARMETVERIGETWLKALRVSGYVAPRGSALAEEKLRRMLRRFAMTEPDAEVFLGMVRKILWKLGAEKK